jgi:hypothetical protein
MKHALCVLLSLAALPEAPAAAGALTVGAGLNSSSTSNPDLFTPPSPPNPAGYVPDPSPRTGWNFGIGYERDVLPWLSLGVQLDLETRGEDALITHPSPNPAPPDVEVELRMLYLHLPMLATVKHSFGSLTLGAFAGPAICRMVQGERERRVNGVEQPVQEEEANRTDFGIEAGCTIEYAIGPGAVFVRPGYYWGLLDFPEDHEAKHRVGKVRLGYKFFL